MPNIICVGSSSKDIFFPTSEGVVLETPADLTSQRKIFFELGAKFHVKDRYEALGGCAANVAGGLAKLGIETKCYTKVGDDYLGDWIKEELRKEGVQTDLVQVEKNTPSDLSAIIVDEKTGERIIFFNRDANENLRIISEKLASADWLFVSALNGNANESWEDNLGKILKISEKEINLAYNPGSENIKNSVGTVIEACRSTAVLILNKDEAIEIVSACDSTLKDEKLNDEVFLIDKLKNLGVGIVALSDGKRGAWTGDGKNVFHAEAIANNPVETTGAGDAFSSGFLAAILKGEKTENALKWGIANSGNSVMFFGAHAGLLDMNKIEMESRKTNLKILR